MLLRKIDVSEIVKDHIKTLSDHASGKLLWWDLMLFFGVPIALGLVAPWKGIQLRAIAVTGVLTASSLFVALLLNLLVMVLTYLRATQGDPTDQDVQLRKRFLRQIATNLSFSIVVALALVSAAIVGLFGLGDDQELRIGRVPTFFLIVMASMLVLNLLMIVRRIYVLIQNEFDTHKIQKKAT